MSAFVSESTHLVLLFCVVLYQTCNTYILIFIIMKKKNEELFCLLDVSWWVGRPGFQLRACQHIDCLPSYITDTSLALVNR